MSNFIQPLTSLTFGYVAPVEERQFTAVTPADRIPPFQIIRAQNTHGLTDVTVEAVYQNGNVVDLYALLDAADPMEIVTLANGTDILIWKQLESLTADIDGGKFYVRVSDTNETWYSKFWLVVRCGSLVAYPEEQGLVINEYEIST